MKSTDTYKTQKNEIKNGTIEDIKEGVSILEKVAQIFISIFSIFKLMLLFIIYNA